MRLANRSQSNATQRNDGKGKGRESNLFHGVEIQLDNPACAAVGRYRDQRLLSDEAPRLPVPGCDRGAECRCVYKHFHDRRTAPRREADVGLPERAPLSDRRSGKPRRVTDG
jgi:hypothetical protein